MSDGMAFLTGAAFAGVAVLFMMKGGANLGATNLPPGQLPQVSPPNPTSPYNPYGTTPQALPTASPYSALTNGQQLDNERLRAMLEQQRAETEQLKAQLQSQQMIIQKLTTQNEAEANNLFAQAQPSPGAAQAQQEDNQMLSGLVWALGGMAITISGGVVVVGALSVLSRQQRPGGRTTYVVQHPYTALPPTIQARRRTEYMPPQVVERQVEHVDYD